MLGFAIARVDGRKRPLSSRTRPSDLRRARDAASPLNGCPICRMGVVVGRAVAPAGLLPSNPPRGNAISILELNQASLHDSARGHSRRVTAALNLASPMATHGRMRM